jgi:DNA-3-methyladenine glycosylase
MFGPPGHAYVYFTYGMHWCVNVVCEPAGVPHAVLLRAGEIVSGEPLARRRRSRPAPSPDAPEALPARELARGPARLCQALAIASEQNGIDLLDPAARLRLWAAAHASCDQGDVTAHEQHPISIGPRVGVSAGADTAWRYWLTNDPTVSQYRAHVRRARKITRGPR